MHAHPEQPPLADPTTPLAVFDFDGTLVRSDSFLPFLLSYGWRRRRFLALLTLPFYLALYALRILSDRAAKERVLIAFLRGQCSAAIAEHADRFCRNWVQRRLRPEVVARLREHQAAGHRVVLLSASPDVYVPAAANHLGISEVICTRVAVVNGRCDGALEGGNCKGPEKVAALRRYLGADSPPPASWAYGDSKSDLPVLNWVGEGWLVRRKRLVRLSPTDRIVGNPVGV